MYGFDDQFELICNLDNYTDQAHYGQWVNSWILKWMRDGDHQLTTDNYQIYLETKRDFYNHYDYSMFHK